MSVTIEISELDADLWDAFQRGGPWIAHSEYMQLKAENAKLRELVLHLYECMCNADADGNHECDSCEYDNAESKCDFVRQMRELGVKVTDGD